MNCLLHLVFYGVDHGCQSLSYPLIYIQASGYREAPEKVRGQKKAHVTLHEIGASGYKLNAHFSFSVLPTNPDLVVR